MRKLDDFWVDLTLNHDHCDTREISEALGVAPYFEAKRGDVVGTITRKSTVWMGHLYNGTGNEAWAKALEDLVKFVDDRKMYLLGFMSSGGQAGISFNQGIAMQEGVIFNLHLEPHVLEVLGQSGISLRVQAWSVAE